MTDDSTLDDATPGEASANSPHRMTIAEIAEAAGVTKPTVSKVLNDRDDVSEATRQRVQRVIRERGYQRNRAVRALHSGHTGLIDFVDPDLDGETLTQIMHGVESALEHTGIRLVMMKTHTSAREERRWMEQILEKSSDGVLLVLPRDVSNIKILVQQHIPFVMIDDRHALPFEAMSVGISHWTGAFTAASYLLSLGHRQIATITGNMIYMSAKARLDGFRAAMDDAGVHVPPEYIRNGDYSHHTAAQIAFDQTEALLRLDQPPTAIMTANDWQAIGVYDAIDAHGLVIPRDISVIGFDDLLAASLLRPKLTTMRRPLFEMGKVATNMLLRLIEGKQVDSTRVELATTLVTRASCAVPGSAISTPLNKG